MDASARQCEQCRAPLPVRAESGDSRRTATLCRPCSKALSIRRAAEKYEAELAARGKVVRTCSKCGDTIAARSGSWPMSHGSPSGTLCLACFHDRQKDVDARIRVKRARSPARQFRVVLAAARALERQRSILGPDADAALRLGADTVNAQAEQVAKKLCAAVDDPESPFHREALELFATRALPMAAISKVAVHLARSGALATPPDSKPQRGPRFILNIGITHGPEKE